MDPLLNSDLIGTKNDTKDDEMNNENGYNKSIMCVVGKEELEKMMKTIKEIGNTVTKIQSRLNEIGNLIEGKINDMNYKIDDMNDKIDVMDDKIDSIMDFHDIDNYID